MFQTNSGPAVKIGASERDPAIVSALDFDVIKNSQGRASREDFTQTGEGGFEFRDGKYDGFHEVVVFLGFE
jgi:hypothetical protein